jgi:hypothetical protein
MASDLEPPPDIGLGGRADNRAALLNFSATDLRYPCRHGAADGSLFGHGTRTAGQSYKLTQSLVGLRQGAI